MKRNNNKRLLVSLVLLAVMGLVLSNNRKNTTASTSGQNTREVEVKMLPASGLSKGQLPDEVSLAIIGSSDFDVTTVDPASIVFAGAGVLVDIKGKYKVSFEDVSYDGFTDLVVRLARGDLRVGSAPTKAPFNARTTSGELLSGTECAQASGVPCGGGFVATGTQQQSSGGELASPDSVTFSQNFDGVVAPALPSGWATSFSNGTNCTQGNNWTTTTTNPSSAPNAAFHNDPTCVTDNLLVSPSINIVSTTATLSFKNAFNLESGFDGTVLEVSTDGGSTWADITSPAISGAGAFTSGGYNRTISVNFLSPIAGRMAWSSLSGGTTAAPAYIDTVANLGANLAGKTVKFRWRCASDSSIAAGGTSGQWVDNFSIDDTIATTCTLTCPANITQSNDPNQCGAVVTYPAPTSTGTCGTVTCSPASGSFFPKGTTTVTCTSSTGSGSCSFTVTVNDNQPPSITCPANITAVTPTPTTPCTVVTYTATASDNCPGVTVTCTPPSGSCFPISVTTVTCTATDTSGNTATCSFTVSVFNGRLQDDSEGCNDTVLFNTLTGDYRWCCHGTIFTGRGMVTKKGDTYTIQHDPADRRVLISLSAGAPTPAGYASLQSPPGTTRCVITDRDIRNDTCVCGSALPMAPSK
jgi:hypothetical protein